MQEAQIASYVPGFAQQQQQHFLEKSVIFTLKHSVN